MKNPTNKSKPNSGAGNDIADAIETIYNFIHQVTGQAPSEAEIAGALKRYFVLNEIKEHIVLERKKNRFCLSKQNLK